MAWIEVGGPGREEPRPSPGEIRQVVEARRRRAKPTFYVDECFPQIATALLGSLRARILTARELGFVGYPDEHHAAFALKRRAVLVSCDRDYLDERRFPLIQAPCIVVFGFGSGSGRDIWRAYGCLSSILAMPEFYDKWTKIDATPDSWAQYSRFLDGTTSRVRYRWHRGRLQEWR